MAQLKAADRRREFLAAYGRDDVATIKEAQRRVRLSPTTYHKWLGDSKSFRNEVEKIKLEKRGQKEADRHLAASDLVLAADREFPPVPDLKTFRWEYFGFPTPTHHDPIIQAYEDKTNLRIVVLGPPGSGKDSISRDIVAHASMEDRATRVAWIMKNELFSKRRIAQRLDPYLTDKATYRTAPEGPGTQKPTKNLIDDFGPFKWQTGMRWSDGSKVEKTTWNKSEIYYIRRGAVEADPNLWATGIEGNLYGARVDLMVVSDPFDREDQRSPTTRQARLDWFMGTARSRLDERGRIIVLGTRVLAGDAYEDLLDMYIAGSRIVKQDGYYTKYANGTATIIYPAIQYDGKGGEVSYWPERFPLHGRIEYLDRDPLILTPELLERKTDRELDELTDVPGAKRVQGLYEIRDSTPSLFETMYQQSPPADADGEFSDLVLDHCDDPSRSFGVHRPDETLILGVDPARSGGAAWVLWGLSPDGVFTLVDYFYGEGLGVQGIKNQLIMEPLRQYLPRYMVYEVNSNSAIIEMPDVLESVKATATDVVRHTTHDYNRNKGDVSVASMVFDMRDGRIRWPAATADDRDRMRLVKEQFKTWDRRSIAKEQGHSRWRSLGPDDVVMGGWVGWVHGKGLSKKKRRNLRGMASKIPAVTTRRWRGRLRESDEQRSSMSGGGHVPSTDLLSAWYGDN